MAGSASSPEGGGGRGRFLDDKYGEDLYDEEGEGGGAGGEGGLEGMLHVFDARCLPPPPNLLSEEVLSRNGVLSRVRFA